MSGSVIHSSLFSSHQPVISVRKENGDVKWTLPTLFVQLYCIVFVLNVVWITKLEYIFSQALILTYRNRRIRAIIQQSVIPLHHHLELYLFLDFNKNVPRKCTREWSWVPQCLYFLVCEQTQSLWATRTSIFQTFHIYFSTHDVRNISSFVYSILKFIKSAP